ncbi:MAG: PaaI family thioesterase [Actinobacteria bacterium]|nr:PaaI family thioesterase [Actinomycetota bacterium]
MATTGDADLSPASVEAINDMVRSAFPGSRNYCHELGTGYAISRLEAAEGDLRPGGFISGPTQFGAADAALWFATFVGLGRMEPMALTSELSIRFLRPAIGSVLFARADVDIVTRRSVVGTVKIWCDDDVDRPTATAQGTYAIPLPK